MPRMRRVVGLLVVSICVACCGSLRIAVADDARLPNIVHIVADDVGYDDVGCFGSPDIQTPNLDRLAAGGRKFTSFYAPSPFCSASRAAMMTGCYADRIGLPAVLFPYSKIGLHRDEITIGELLQTCRYRTAVIGKWHLGHLPQFLPPQNGFDRFFGIPYPNDHEPERRGWSQQAGREGYIPPPMPLWRDREIIEEPADLASLPQRFTAEAVKFIKENRDRRFYLHFANVETHTPWFTSPRFMGTSAAGSYGDAVRSLDWSVGELVAALYQHGLLEHTLIVFHADNGYLAPTSNRSDLPGIYGKYATVDPNRKHVVRGGKGTVYEGGVRVACIASWQGHIPAGSTCDEISASFDLYATFAKLAGGELPSDRAIDGRDITPLLLGLEGAKSPHESFYYYLNGALGGVRRGNWKLLFPGVGRGSAAPKPGPNAQPELFNLAEDLGETRDLAGENPQIVQQLLAIAERARDDIGDVRTGRTGQRTRPVGRAE